MPNTDGADAKKQGTSQPKVKNLGPRPGSAVPSNAKVKRLPTTGRSPYGRLR